jgi:hypothetical protein
MARVTALDAMIPGLPLNTQTGYSVRQDPAPEAYGLEWSLA